MLSDEYQRIPLELIDVKRDDRQRRTIDTASIIDSIRVRGVLQPIIVERSANNSGRYTLIAGERRFTASCELKLPDIPARLAETLSHSERQVIELEENVRRRDLPWQDECRAYQRIHSIYCELNPDGWTQVQTADAIGISPNNLSEYLTVANGLAGPHREQLEAASGIRAAYNMLARRNERAMDDVMNDLLGGIDEPIRAVRDPGTSTDVADAQHTFDRGTVLIRHNTPNVVSGSVEIESILNQSFLDWAPSYSGPQFNFIHCDFPYGINLDKSDQGKSDQWGGYDDSPDTYWALCAALAANVDRLMAPSSHLMFWFSMEYYHETLTFFREKTNLKVQTFPLIWHKTDNRGILPDPSHGPRRVYETCLIASRGDRLIVRSVSNAYGAPTSKEIHQSEKPEPMLRHFFQMFIDQNSRVLDPTCGSGTALRAAETLGASSVLGLEINPEFCAAARTALRKSRRLSDAFAYTQPA